MYSGIFTKLEFIHITVRSGWITVGLSRSSFCDLCHFASPEERNKCYRVVAKQAQREAARVREGDSEVDCLCVTKKKHLDPLERKNSEKKRLRIQRMSRDTKQSLTALEIKGSKQTNYVPSDNIHWFISHYEH